jgi:hypothetical protein
MRSLRTLAALALALLGLAVGVPSASAIDPFPTDGIMTLSNPNFTVHYDGNDNDATCKDFTTEERAGEIAGMLDRARTFYAGMGLGWPAPVPDSDSHVHVAIENFGGGCSVYGVIPFGTPQPLTRWDAVLEPIGGGADNIHLNMGKDGLKYPVIAHEVFHLIEDALAPGVDQWLQEGTAEWAAIRANNAAGGFGVNPDRTLDCVGTRCGDTEYDKNGYPGWMLFEYLAERYGDAKVKAVWDQAAASPGAPGTTDLANVLPSGTSLASFFNDYTTARMTGNFTMASLAGSRPQMYANVPVGTTSGTLPAAAGCGQPSRGAVHHAHARIRPDAAVLRRDADARCHDPGGRRLDPDVLREHEDVGRATVAVTGSTASITVPWNTVRRQSERVPLAAERQPRKRRAGVHGEGQRGRRPEHARRTVRPAAGRARHRHADLRADERSRADAEHLRARGPARLEQDAGASVRRVLER